MDAACKDLQDDNTMPKEAVIHSLNVAPGMMEAIFVRRIHRGVAWKHRSPGRQVLKEEAEKVPKR